jgi:lipopolysaccharide transport system ATP-binding protein
MGELNKVGNKTVLFVSHNIAAISNLCSEGILLEKGRVVETGIIDDVIKKYDEKNILHLDSLETEVVRNLGKLKSTYFSSAVILNSEFTQTTSFKYGETIILNLSIHNNLGGGGFSPEFYIYNELGI